MLRQPVALRLMHERFMRDSLLTRLGMLAGLLSILFGLSFSARAMAQEVGASATPARLDLFVFEGGRPVDGLNVRFADAVGRTADGGTWRAELVPGFERLEVFDQALPLLALPMRLRPGEIVQVIVTLVGEERRARVAIESSLGELGVQLEAPVGSVAPGDAGSGLLLGQVLSSEDGRPVVDARVFVSGTPLELRTDDEGRFEAEVPVGRYSISVLHAEFATRTVDGVEIALDATTERSFELPPAGLELAEFVVIEPFIEGSLSGVVALRRESTAVTDVLSAEQISRAGDSDAGSALKRVTGLTLVDGSFIYVRGLGERYSSVLLNGANLPSPDPTRRVLPMDLFPTDIISQIVVQKTSDASMPGGFGGGTVQLGTVSFPAELSLKIGLSSGYNTKSTGKNGLSYAGGDRDWTGFDDGTRNVPPLLNDEIGDGSLLQPASRFNPDGVSPEELEAIGEELAARSAYSTQEKELPADRGLTLSIGNSWTVTDDIRVGLEASLRYSDKWRLRDEMRNAFSASDAGLSLKDQFALQRTLRNIDVSGFLTGGIEFSDWTTIGSNVMLLRQTEDETRLLDGIEDSQQLQRTTLEWTTNQLFAAQAFGDHRLPWTGTEANWQFTIGKAKREDPNVIDFRRDDDNENGQFVFSSRADSNSQSWANVDDDLTDWSFALKQPLPAFGPIAVNLQAGMAQTERDRIAGRRTFSFGGRLPAGANELDQDDLLTPEFIGPGSRQLRLREDTQPTDNFTAEQKLSAWFAMTELTVFEDWTLIAGLRQEDNFQTVETEDLGDPNAPPLVSLIDEKDDLLSGSLTWRFLGNAQLRLGYAETLSRPDFREISPAPFVDPVLDLRTVGNPNLRVSSIVNYDARIEYYFTEIDSISFAYFYKDLTDPIERVVSSGGSGTTIFLENALGAEVEGWEIDVYRGLGFINDWDWLDRIRMGWLRRSGLANFYFAANYSDISTDVSIDPNASNQTNPDRALEGASPWVVNLQLGYNSPSERWEWTLLYNSFGERISRAGALGQPDIFEEPFEQLDLTAKYRHGDHWTFKLGVDNILDSKVRFTQGPETTRVFKPGISFSLGVDFRL